MSKHARRKLLAGLYGDQCFYCGCSFTLTGSRSRTLDHLVPLSRFPQAVMMPRHPTKGQKKDNTAWELWNLVLACSGCNNAKGNLIWYEYYQTETYWKRRQAINLERESKKSRSLTKL